MTRHRLILCNLEHLTGCAGQLHPDLDGSLPDQTSRWFTHRMPPGAAVLGWSSRGPVGTLSFCLEVERSACGVLVHLTVTPLLPTNSPNPSRMTRGLAEIWAARQLNSLSRLVAETAMQARHEAA